jgi:ABC-2 type transport system permease protein
MPVSDAQTVFSKFLSGFVLAPVIYLLCIICLQVIIFITITLYGLALEVDIWEAFWTPSHLFSRWLEYLIYFLLAGLWCLPVYAWFLLLSSWARTAPLAWAVGLPVVMGGFEFLYFGTTRLLRLLFEHTIPIMMFLPEPTDFFEKLRGFLNLEMLIGIVLGSVFIYAAIFLRNRTGEI